MAPCLASNSAGSKRLKCKTDPTNSILSLGFILVWAPVWAGGLYLQEFGTPSMGVASAGAEAVAMDASTSFHNPAGMTRIEGKEFMLTGGLLYGGIQFDPAPNTPVPGGDGGNAGGLAPLMGAFYVHSISDRIGFCLWAKYVHVRTLFI